jgi:hypothetical protein
MNNIIWKTLIYNGIAYEQFEASNDGQIRNINTGTIYKQHVNKNGYSQVCVSLGSRKNKKVFRVHKAIAETFIPNPENKKEVNHIDGNKQHNCVSNLEWVTGTENMIHARDNGLLHPLRGVNSPCAKLTEEDVIYIREHYIPRDSIYGARALGRKFDVNKNTILSIMNGTSYVNV